MRLQKNTNAHIAIYVNNNIIVFSHASDQKNLNIHITGDKNVINIKDVSFLIRLFVLSGTTTVLCWITKSAAKN